MLRKIKLYGELAKFLGQKTFEAEVSNAAQAMRFLVVNFPQLEKHMMERYYKVSVGNWELTEEELTYPNGRRYKNYSCCWRCWKGNWKIFIRSSNDWRWDSIWWSYFCRW